MHIWQLKMQKFALHHRYNLEQISGTWIRYFFQTKLFTKININPAERPGTMLYRHHLIYSIV